MKHVSGKQAIVFLLIFSAILAVIVSDRVVGNRQRLRETQEFQSLDFSAITWVEIRARGSLALIKRQVFVQDTVRIRAICQTIREATMIDPSHPDVKWDCDLQFVTQSKIWSFKVCSTGKYGVLIYLKGGKILRNDQLGPMLEHIAKYDRS